MNPPTTTPLNEKDRLGEILEDVIISGSALGRNKKGEFDSEKNYLAKKNHTIESAKQELTKLIQTLEKKARIDELKVFTSQLENNHHDMPIGTARDYVAQQYMERLTQLEKGTE